MAEKFTGKDKKGEHEAGIVTLEYKGPEAPIEPPPKRGCEPRIEEPPIPPAHKKGQSSVHKKRKK